MVQCLQVDENKRPTISNLKNLSFFEKLKTNTTYLSLGPRRLMNPTIEVSRNSNTQFSNERGRPTSLSSHYNGPKPNTININRNVFKK